MGNTRERIVSATLELFRRRGYNGTSLKMITDASAATTGSLYHFFPAGKDQLAAAVLRDSGAAYLELFELFAEAHTNITEAMEHYFEGGALVLEETGFIDPCPIGTVAREVASVNEPLRQVTDEVFQTWIEAASSRFRQAGLDRNAATDLATAVVALIEGGFVLARAANDAAPFRACGRLASELVASRLAAARV